MRLWLLAGPLLLVATVPEAPIFIRDAAAWAAVLALGWGGALTYFFFLIFAQFALLKLSASAGAVNPR